MHFNLAGAANTVTNFMGATFLLSIVGGFISDTYLSRLHTGLIFGVLELLALALVTIQARFEKLHPKPCGVGKSSCVEGGIAVMLYASLCLLALGAGGVKGSVPALGADQFDRKVPKEEKALATYFNWLLLSTTLGATFGVTVIVWVSMHKGWYWGFFISLMLALIGFVFLALGKPFYRIQVPGESPIIKIAQVIVLAIKNGSFSLPEHPSELYEINDKETVFTEDKIPHTDQFRILDKAAILPKDSEPEPWTVCTVTQVEEVKILTRMLPIIGSTIIMNTCLAQLSTFSIQQGSIMNLYLGKYEVPAPTIPVIPLLFMSILIPVYEFIFVPLARKITHHPSGITQLQRVGVGLVLSIISMSVAGIVEVKRRDSANRVPAEKISVFWLCYQFCIFGIADMFTLVGLLEFFYKEAPTSMKSLSTSFTWISLSFGYFLSSIFVSMINAITRRITPSKKGWLYGDDLNKNNLNLFYWFLAVISCLNFANYLYWASWYKYKIEDSGSATKTEASPLKGSSFSEEASIAKDGNDDTSSPKELHVDHEEKIKIGNSSPNVKEHQVVEAPPQKQEGS